MSNKLLTIGKRFVLLGGKENGKKETSCDESHFSSAFKLWALGT